MAFFRRGPHRRRSAPREEPRTPQPLAPPPAPAQFLRDNDIRTSLGPDAVINGRLSFSHPTRLEGKLTGELRCTDVLVIGETAVIEGMIKATEIRIEGTVRGEIFGTERVEIFPSGRFAGRLRVRALVLHDGGTFDGECRMGEEPAAEELGLFG